MDLKRYLAKLSDPFPMIVGAATVASGVAFSAPFVVAGGVGLWLAAGAAGLMNDHAKPTMLPWGEWAGQVDDQHLPQPLDTQLLAILSAGKQVEEASRAVQIAEPEIQADLRQVMQDVLRTGVQGKVLSEHLASWDIAAVRHRATTTADPTEEQALQEQIAVYERLSGRFDDLMQRLATLAAQLGATRANLLQASVSTSVPGEVSDAMTQLKTTAHTIAESYDTLAADPLDALPPTA